MRAELIEVVETELRKFATDLNLSDEQKSQLKTALEKAHERIDEIRAKNPNASRADVRHDPRAGGEVLHPGAAREVGQWGEQGQDVPG